MNTQLQQLIEELKARKERIQSSNTNLTGCKYLRWHSKQKGKLQILSLLITKLTKILNEGSVAASSDYDRGWLDGWKNRPC
jgi:hypothetical protein